MLLYLTSMATALDRKEKSAKGGMPMCIIAAKAKGVKMPDRKTIRTMWYGNPDGAGVMYTRDGKVKIHKGFMTLTALEKFLDKLENELDLTETPVVMHFRITTHGGTKAENTHPFPVTDSIKRLKLTHCATNLGVAHNGIIDIKPRSYDISDTMEYIASQLAPLSRALPDFYKNRDAMQMIQNAIKSRMAFLTGEGEIYLTGDFVEDNGVMYSNESFRGRFRYSWCYDEDRDWFYRTTSATKGKATSSSKGKTKGKATSTSSTKGKTKGKAEPEPLRLPSPTDVASAELMWMLLARDGGYVITKDGSILEGDDFLIDADEHVYLWDQTLDACTPVDDATAFTGAGLPMRFNPDLASDEFVLVD